MTRRPRPPYPRTRRADTGPRDRLLAGAAQRRRTVVRHANAARALRRAAQTCRQIIAPLATPRPRGWFEAIVRCRPLGPEPPGNSSRGSIGRCPCGSTAICMVSQSPTTRVQAGRTRARAARDAAHPALSDLRHHSGRTGRVRGLSRGRRTLFLSEPHARRVAGRTLVPGVWGDARSRPAGLAARAERPAPRSPDDARFRARPTG